MTVGTCGTTLAFTLYPERTNTRLISLVVWSSPSQMSEIMLCKIRVICDLYRESVRQVKHADLAHVLGFGTVLTYNCHLVPRSSTTWLESECNTWLLTDVTLMTERYLYHTHIWIRPEAVFTDYRKISLFWGCITLICHTRMQQCIVMRGTRNAQLDAYRESAKK